MHPALIALPEAQRSALETAYAAPPRAYHNFHHVLEVLRHCDEVEAGPGWRQAPEVHMAVLYHDAIYEAGRGDNEVRSAQLARQAIARWMPEENIDVERVVQLIELTARHGSLSPQQVDAEAALFLDCDMAILGASAGVFDAYDHAIAQEYLPIVPAEIFRQKRRAFLLDLLARERIYLSDFFHTRLDAAARDNLRRVTKSSAHSP